MEDTTNISYNETTAPEIPKELTPRAKKSMQGWTAQHGTGAHAYYADAVEDALDETAVRDSLCREVSSEFKTSENKEIDTFIQKGNKGLVIDYKTHDMSNWSASDANKYGKEHGQQVQGYLTSISESEKINPENLWGYIVPTGKLPKNKDVLDIYSSTLNKYNVNLAISPTGDSEGVVSTVKELTKKHKL